MASQTQRDRGGYLFANLHARYRILSDQDITDIAVFLDQEDPGQICYQGSSVPFHCKDLPMGRKRETPDLAAVLGSTPGENTAAEHFNEETQRDAAEFIKSDIRIEKQLARPLAWMQLVGVTRRFYHYQVYAAFWLIRKERGHCRGSILADLMGLGKTTITYLYILFNFWLVENAEHVKNYPLLHCRPSGPEYTQPPDARCLSAARWPITCRCVESSPTFRCDLTAITGGTLILLPKSLIGSWEREWRDLGVSGQIIPHLYINHSLYEDNRLQPGSTDARALILQKDFGLQQGLSAQSRHPKLQESTTPGSHGVIVVTTVESYKSQVRDLYNAKWQWHVPHGEDLRNEHFHDGLHWARVIRDEAHLTTGWNTQSYGIIRSMAHGIWRPPNLLFLTATPMLRNGVADMLSMVKAINAVSPKIGQHSLYTGFSADENLEDLARMFLEVRQAQMVGSVDARREKSVAELVGKLISAYCIRRCCESVQNGKKLAWVPLLDRYDVECPGPPHGANYPFMQVERMLKRQMSRALAEKWQQVQQKGGEVADLILDADELFENILAGRILASVPALVRYQQLGRVLTWKFIKDNKWHLPDAPSVFAQDLAALEASSGKLAALRALILNLGHDTARLPEKLVVVSEFPVICLIVSHLCRAMAVACAWMHADLNAIEREELVGAFQGLRDAGPVVLKEIVPRVLVGSSAIMGQGLTLNKAFRLVLMEPGRHLAVEEQVAKRVHRIGSRTDRCSFYRFFNPDSSLERILIEEHDNQARLQALVEWCNSPDGPECDQASIFFPPHTQLLEGAQVDDPDGLSIQGHYHLQM